MNYLEFYTSILACAGSHPDDKGFISLDCDGEKIPLTISQLPVALPTRELVAESNDKIVLFHPASESLIRKESPVSKQFRKLLTLRLNDVARQVMVSLVDFAEKTEGHKRATPDQRDFLGLVADMKPKTAASIKTILDTVDGKLANRIVSQAIRTGVKLGDVEYKRVSNITFPLLKNISVTEKNWNGIKFAAKDIRLVQELAEYVFPDFMVKDEYSTGTHEMQVPNLHCMMSGLLPVYQELNRIIAIFDLDDKLMFDVSFEAGLSKLAKYKALVPSQPGNDGEPMDTDDDEVEEVKSSAVASNAKAAAASSQPLVAVSSPVQARPVPSPSQSVQGSVKQDEQPWMRADRERRGEMTMSQPDIEGALPDAEYRKLSWSDRNSYDKWYAEELAKRQHELAMAAQYAQNPGYMAPGGYGNQYQPQYQHQYSQRPMSARERYEAEQKQMQQYHHAPMRSGRSVRY